MATYGKKKKSILPSFSVLRDSSSVTKPNKENNKKRSASWLVRIECFLVRPCIEFYYLFTDSVFITVSTTYSTSILRGTEFPGAKPSRHDDSIDEIASMLLDDTEIDQPCTEPARRLSYIPTSHSLSGIPFSSSRDTKTLPQLPQLMFNGDDAWAMRTAPVVTAAGSYNEVQFSFEGEAVAASPVSNLPIPIKQPRKDITPPIPRKSSKRKSGRPKASSTQLGKIGSAHSTTMKRVDRSSISPPKHVTKSGPSSNNVATDVNDKIEAMIAATKALKPGYDNTLLQGPCVPVKKRRLKDNKVFAKVKTVFNDRMPGRSDRKRHDSLRDDYLLGNSSSNDLPTADDSYVPSPALSNVSEVERRLNEGNFPGV